MRRTILWLSIGLVLQIILFCGLQWGKQGHGAFAGGKLLPLDQKAIDLIKIEGHDKEPLLLQKTTDGWVLPDHFDAPADPHKVKNLLTTLFGIKRTWPVADSSEAISRFKLAADNFERRLIFQADGKPQGTLLLGSSPGFRKVHARLAKEQQVFDIPFSSYQASLKAGDWLDKNLLQLDQKQISAIQLPDCRLVREDGQLILDKLAAHEMTAAKSAQALLERLANISVLDVYGKADDPLSNPSTLSIDLELKDGGVRQYDFYPANDGKQDRALLKSTSVDQVYLVSGSLVKDLQKVNRASLVTTRQDPESKPDQTAALKKKP